MGDALQRWWAGWRLPLLLAARDARRARARSALVLLMIGLPVLAVSAAAVTVATSDVRGTEDVDRRLGASEALVSVQRGIGTVLQGADPGQGGYSSTGPGPAQLPGATQVAEALGGARLLELREGGLQLRSDDGVVPASASEVDLTDPLARGLFRLTSGRWPAGTDEVVVNQALLDQGYAVGDRLRPAAEDDPSPRVVGVAESTTTRSTPVVAGDLGSTGVVTEGSRSWLAGGAPVRWSDVRRLNAIGATVVSRAVLLDPPPASEVPAEVRSQAAPDPERTAVLALVVAMVLLEIVLLAGPAFAVGARRQARTLALVVACGGTPGQARRLVLATAVVLGAVAAAAGVGLGIGGAALAMPLLQRLSSTWFGPFDVPWRLLAGVGALGFASALLAALAPAVLASRQDVVAVLAGRRGEPRPSRRSPVLGVALLAVGMASSAAGATGGAELGIAAGGVCAVLGMVLLVPLLLAALGRVARRLPLTLRYAVRDAARQRTRTAPAVAAVAATVAGVVALGIGASSDAEEARRTYAPTLVSGAALVAAGYDLSGRPEDPDWSALRAAVRREAPAAEVTEVTGLAGADTYVEVRRPGDPEGFPLRSYGSSLGSSELVGPEALEGMPGMTRGTRAQARAALAAGRVVVLADEVGAADRSPDARVSMTVQRLDPTSGEAVPGTPVTLPATYLPAPATSAAAQVLLPPSAADELGVPVRTVGLLLGGPTLTPAEEEAVGEAVRALAPNASVTVERGYQDDEQELVLLLVLGALGAVLMLGGTLTATLLSLSDARPDLATLAAVGASPGTRRRLAAAYALVVGGVGAVIGAAVGFVPGLAVAVPLTSTDYGGGPTGPFLDVPWLLVLGLVVVLPLLTALLVGACTRSRLPLVARAA